MEIQTYIDQKKEFHLHFLIYIDSDEIEANDLEILKINLNKAELQNFLRFILLLAHNHHRKFDFFNKIEYVLLNLREKIKQAFTNNETYSIFKTHKRILLFLFQNKIIELDKTIVHDFIIKTDINGINFCHFFYTEIKDIINDEIKNKIENDLLNYDQCFMTNFEEKRQIGENDSYICSLIRQDKVQEFITYVNQLNIPLTSTIRPSIFETNSLLIKRKSTSLIQYAAFFGSIQIFKFLQLNNVQLEPSLWIYTIHSKNPELIHLLEENEVKPIDNSFDEVLKESIKCHHNDITDYIIDNLLDKNAEEFFIKNEFARNIFYYSFCYQNYQYFPENLTDSKFVFFYLCKFDYLELVKLLNKTEKLNLISTVISFNWHL